MRTPFVILLVIMLAGTLWGNVPQLLNYQGQLTSSAGAPLDTSLSFSFAILDGPGFGATVLWSETQTGVAVHGGLFNVLLGSVTTFPPGLFDNASLWLGLAVGADGEMSPRTQIVSGAFAQRVQSVNGSNGGTILSDLDVSGNMQADTLRLNNTLRFADGTYQSSVFDSSSLSNRINRKADSTDNATRTWVMSKGYLRGANNVVGSSGFVGGGDYNKARGLYSVIGGGGGFAATDSNSVAPATFRSTIGGGGANNVTNDFSTIGGGYQNVVSGIMATVSGGAYNRALGDYSVVAGGGGDLPDSNLAGGLGATVSGGVGNRAVGNTSTVSGGSGNNIAATGTGATISGGGNNTASGDRATVSGGGINTASGSVAVVSGGILNTASGAHSTICGGETNSSMGFSSAIGGGVGNNARGDYSVIAGGGGPSTGDSNSVTGAWSFIGGGHRNFASALFSVIGGGNSNVVSDIGAFVAGGTGNTASGRYSAVGGGTFNIARGVGAVVAGGGSEAAIDSNVASGNSTSIGGGRRNICSGVVSVIGGGDSNVSSASRSTVAGGVRNSAIANEAFVGGGADNTASGVFGTVAGGDSNIASASYTTIPGGFQNLASAQHSFAAGRSAQAIHLGSFVWSSGGDTTLSWGNNTFTARAPGGARFYTDIAATNVGASLAGGSGSWSALSDSTSKRRYGRVDTRAILNKIATLPIERWSYKTQDESIQHIGPMAQDFYAAFGVGEDNTTISSVDPDGIALAAIQELERENSKLKIQSSNSEKAIEELHTAVRGYKDENAKLEAELAELRAAVQTLQAEHKQTLNSR